MCPHVAIVKLDGSHVSRYLPWNRTSDLAAELTLLLHLVPDILQLCKQAPHAHRPVRLPSLSKWMQSSQQVTRRLEAAV